jgi:UDP-2,3-diacylglucosamine hydrolase
VAKSVDYIFKGEQEPLYIYSLEYSKKRHVDYFIFGHFHCKVDMTLPTGARLLVLKDWMDAGQEDYFVFNSTDASLGCFGIS